MEHVLSTHLFVNHRLTTALLDKIQAAGFQAVEIFCARQHLDYRNRAQINELKHWFRDSGLELRSLHAPMYSDDVWGRSGPNAVINITETVKPKRIQMVDEIKRALDIAESIPFRYLIQHVGVSGEDYDERKMEAAFTSLEELSLFARHRGVSILLENIPNGLSTAERLVHFLAETHLDLGFCLDVGHANMKEGVAEAFGLMQERIRSTHLHDNDGVSDSHLFPFADGGTIDWAETMKLLGSRPGQYPLLLELREVPGMANPLEEAKRIFERLETLRE
ncbi:MAG: sugar phosphate isomerase/epimerase family protein [Bryobacterales bacterium]|nr:sugar phosphate isomerase/epimerase [Bryobacteraceae bacterium]MDW8356130.1 sugar phosphate isomerase/epimerase family protein [Bryobacterales bacterium]